ncbi:MAG: type I glutamate--ammonia ligase [Candidatus Cloacimonadota bacterium]|nr:type I glutamate--ammonia ligase [Candidatus Cloacimonadota bacterium]
MNLEQIKEMIKIENVKNIDFKYSDLFGRTYHISFPARRLDYVVKNGIPFDGSSIPGMKSVEQGDMIIMPDIETAKFDYFTNSPTITMLCYVVEADTLTGVKKDPKSVAKRAQKYLEASGVADQSFWIPEFEFHLFDEANYSNHKFDTGYTFSSSEDKKCLPYNYEDVDATSQDFRKGYHMDTPFDKFADVRQEMVELMEENDIAIRYHHHEVGLSAQQEIETELNLFPKIADDAILIKEIIRNVALENDLTATFMPKPIYNEAGNGMHFHIMLKKNGENIFYKDGNYASLSDEALYFIGGILKHGRSITAFTNPSTNSYKRLLSGFEAPTNLFFGLANRSAAIRIPKYATSKESKRIEFRTGDATCNIYLAMSALLMAGLDGIKNKIMPTQENGFGPFDDNVFSWSDTRKKNLLSVPTSLEEALKALEDDYEYLLEGDVFNEDLINSWIIGKLKEVEAVKIRPHPFEMNLYYNC